MPAESKIPNCLISVIVPIYNKAPYLEQTLLSIIYQTYSELEIILIDDGSNDGCEAICDKFAEQDIRIKVIHTSNEGASRARNLGLSKAAGEYIYFMDADDVLGLNFLEEMIRGIGYTKLDVAYCLDNKADRSYWEKRNSFELYGGAGEDASFVTIMNAMETQFLSLFRPTCWKYLLRKNFLLKNQLYFPDEFFWGEDRIYIPKVLLAAKYVVVVKSPIVFRRHDPARHQNMQIKQQFKEDLPTRFIETLRKFGEANCCLEWVQLPIDEAYNEFLKPKKLSNTTPYSKNRSFYIFNRLSLLTIRKQKNRYTLFLFSFVPIIFFSVRRFPKSTEIKIFNLITIVSSTSKGS